MEMLMGEEKLNAREIQLLCSRECAGIVFEVWLLKYIVPFRKKTQTKQQKTIKTLFNQYFFLLFQKTGARYIGFS